MQDDEADALLDAAIEKHAGWAREQQVALVQRSPHVRDAVVLLVVDAAETKLIGCVTMDVMRDRIAANQPALLAAIEKLGLVQARIVALGFGRWRVHEERLEGETPTA